MEKAVFECNRFQYQHYGVNTTFHNTWTSVSTTSFPGSLFVPWLERKRKIRKRPWEWGWCFDTRKSSCRILFFSLFQIRESIHLAGTGKYISPYGKRNYHQLLNFNVRREVSNKLKYSFAPVNNRRNSLIKRILSEHAWFQNLWVCWICAINPQTSYEIPLSGWFRTFLLSSICRTCAELVSVSTMLIAVFISYYLFFLLVSQRITNWNIAHREGRIRYHPTVGEIEIKVDGVYFVYSQMFYADETAHHMAHDTYINGEREMSCEASIIGQTKNVDTKYQGRIFRLQANDTISVRGRYTKKFKMEPWGSFFGAFLVHLWEMTSF